uniref:Uncharacterized protein n=1 Tax=Amorphochlora amoebiformis TaxID=1561963 RepID=A0A7S0CY53_9EUKA
MGTEVGGQDAGKLEKASEFDLVHGLDAQTCTAETSDKQEYTVPDPMEPNLGAVISWMEDTKPRVRLEKRDYMPVPYGEIIGQCNPADGNRWDIYCPGFNGFCGSPGSLSCSPDDNSNIYKIKSVDGVYILSNGNSKIAVDLEFPPPVVVGLGVENNTCALKHAYERKLRENNSPVTGYYCKREDIDENGHCATDRRENCLS